MPTVMLPEGAGGAVLPVLVGGALALGPGMDALGSPVLVLPGAEGLGPVPVDAELAVGAPVAEAPGGALVLPAPLLPTPVLLATGLPLATAELEPVPLGDVG